MVKDSMTPFASIKMDDVKLENLPADKEQDFHPDIRRGPPPEFTGDRNPQTGEIGGPKTEPVKWGEWSFGGRATDF